MIEPIIWGSENSYRADTSHSAVTGIGIGMSVVKHIVEAHGGEVAVESTPEVGTSVRFTVPTSP
ncbi:MAG: ATP-binding protein [Desulfuromonadales bacterium]|nr:ATP-binding protein [Desulfuromonadales bacterium]